MVAEVHSAANKTTISAGPFAVESRPMVRATLDRVGCEYHVVWPALRHRVMGFINTILPDAILDKATIKIMREKYKPERKIT